MHRTKFASVIALLARRHATLDRFVEIDERIETRARADSLVAPASFTKADLLTQTEDRLVGSVAVEVANMKLSRIRQSDALKFASAFFETGAANQFAVTGKSDIGETITIPVSDEGPVGDTSELEVANGGAPTRGEEPVTVTTNPQVIVSVAIPISTDRHIPGLTEAQRGSRRTTVSERPGAVIEDGRGIDAVAIPIASKWDTCGHLKCGPHRCHRVILGAVVERP